MFLLKNMRAGVLILIGIFIASRKAGIFASIANIIGCAIVTVLGSNRNQINDGLFGYNVILIALA
ncbi:urea transporter [Staphylococcus aureus]